MSSSSAAIESHPLVLAVVMSRFPAVTETFILRELIELENRGVRVELAPLLHDQVTTLHPEAEPWDARALYTPFLNFPMLVSNLKLLFGAPRRYLGTLLALLWEARSSLNLFFGTLGIFPKSVYNGQRLRERGVDHVHAHFATHPATCAYIMDAVRLPGQSELPYSLTIHAHDIFISSAGVVRKFSGARFVRSISRFNIDWLLERFASQGLQEELFRVIHCGIEPGLYSHTPAPGDPGRERPARLLAIASHRPYKGLTYLIEAVRLLRADGVDVQCDVIGDGVLRPQLEAQIRQAGLEDFFRLQGTTTQAGVAEAFAICDAFVLPSIVAPDGQMEGIPVVLMEALAAEVPTISTRISGIPELVRDGETGSIVEPEDPEALAAAISVVFSDYAAAKQRASFGARLVADEFEIRGNVRRLIDEITSS